MSGRDEAFWFGQRKGDKKENQATPALQPKIKKKRVLKKKKTPTITHTEIP